MIKRKDGFSGERALVLPASIIHTMENNPLANALHITDIGYYPRAEHHFRKRETPISQYVFIYCVEGRGWFSVNDERYEIKSNQCFILPANGTKKMMESRTRIQQIFFTISQFQSMIYFFKQIQTSINT